jgi:hypothetical protein
MLERVIARHHALVIEGERTWDDPDPEPANRRIFAAATLADLIAAETGDQAWTEIAQSLKARIARRYRRAA